MAVARKMLSSFEDGEEVSPSTPLRRSAMCDRITSFLSDEALCKSICSHCAKKLMAEQLATSHNSDHLLGEISTQRQVAYCHVCIALGQMRVELR